MQEQMKHEVKYSPKSQCDLDEIWDYITQELGNPAAAARVVGSILDAVEQLEDFPKLGKPLDAITPVEHNYRFLTCGNYLVFYRICPSEVFVDRILYGRRDYLRILFADYQETES